MNSDQPLKGFHVLFPRGGEAAKKFAQSVETAGGIPHIIPLIDFRSIDFTVQHQRYDWIIFTSQNAVRSFLEKGKPDRMSAKMAAVGKKTAEAIEKAGLTVQFTPSLYVTDVFVKEFAKAIHRGEKILLPRGNLAPPRIKNELTAKGALVEDPVVYETYFPSHSREQLIELLDHKYQNLIMVFTSPSTVRHFMDIHFAQSGRIAEKKYIFAVIGTSTQKALRTFGIEADILPEQYTYDHLFEAIVKYMNQEVY